MRWQRLAGAGLVVLLVGGCLGPGGGDNVDRGTVVVDRPLQAVTDAYYDVAPGGESTAMHNLLYFTAGALGGDVRFHTFQEVEAKLEAWNTTHARFVEVDVLGTSRNGHPIWHAVLTDETVNRTDKIAALLDGGHHGNEYGGSEIMLYAGDMLLANLDNATVRALLRSVEVHIVPVVNPDGYIAGTRHNGAGVNLNRNYDIDWGNPFGTSNPLIGTVGGTTGMPASGVALAAENCGAFAFSEPETQAMRDLMHDLKDRVALYLSGHTPTHAVIAPPAAFDPPFTVPDDHRTVLDAELEWIRTHTEYEAGRAQWGDLSAGLPYAASGSSMDYFYLITGKPAFTVEVEYFVTSATADDYPGRLIQPYEGLRFWMDATLPLPMHLVANAHELHAWQSPDRPPIVPAGFVLPSLPDREHAPPLWPYLH